MAEDNAVQEPMPTHPEEMRAAYNWRIGNMISLQGSARITPAGVIAGGLVAAAIVGIVVFGSRPRRRRWP